MDERALRDRNRAAVAVQGLARQDDGAAVERPRLAGAVARPYRRERKLEDLGDPRFGLAALAATAEIEQGAHRRADRAAGQQGAGGETADRQRALEDIECRPEIDGEVGNRIVGEVVRLAALDDDDVDRFGRRKAGVPVRAPQ